LRQPEAETPQITQLAIPPVVLVTTSNRPARSKPPPQSVFAKATRLDARSGSKVRIEGTSTLHDWQVESPLIMGFLEVGPNFPLEPGQAARPGEVEAYGEATVMVRQLRSIEKDGKYYSDAMDTKMWDMMKLPHYPTIAYHLNELVLKEAPKSKDDPYVFDSTGQFAVAGKTNEISMMVMVFPLGEKNGDKRVKITGSALLKMTDYDISPNSITLSKTGDEMTIKFDWVLGRKSAAGK
jgi:hypothetical protein